MSEQVNSKSNSSSRHASSKSKPNVKKSIRQEESPPADPQPPVANISNTWRSGWEIDLERQHYLDKCRRRTPDIEKGIYPFKDVQPKLTAADVGWLLETHDNGSGPVDFEEVWLHPRTGLDLRGAELQGADLRRFPLTCMLGGFNWDEQRKFDSTQAEKAAIHLEAARLENADLRGVILSHGHLEDAHLSWAHLEGAYLNKANLRGATLTQAYLDGADLSGANLEEASLSGAHLETSEWGQTTLLFEAILNGADLRETHMEKASLNRAFLQGADLRGAHLEKADLRNAHLEGKLVDGADLERIQKWAKKFSGTLPPANLQGAFFAAGTNLERITLSDEKFGCVSLADMHWGDANLSVIEWSQIKVVGDERRAMLWRNHPKRANFAPVVIEDYQQAVRTYRQLATTLQSQGLNEEATRFGYRAQMLHRRVLWMRLGLWKSTQRLKIWVQRSRIWRQLIVLGQGVQQSWVWRQFVAHIVQWTSKFGIKVQQLGTVLFSTFLGLLVGYGYRPGRALMWYLIVILGFTTAYSLVGHIPFLPDAVVFSIMSFHGRGFFPSLSNETSLHNPLVVLAAAEAVIGLFIEISFIATFTRRFFGS